MKRFRIHSVFAALLLCSGLSWGNIASAQLWQGGEMYAPKQFSAGFYGQLYGQTYTLPSAVMGFGQFTYGVLDNFQLEARLGLGMIDFYVGAFAKFQLMRVGIFELATLIGIHKQLSLYADWDLIASLDWPRWQVYLAPIFNASLAVPIGLALIPGAVFKINDSLRIYGEGHLNFTGLFWSGSLGLKYLFN